MDTKEKEHLKLNPNVITPDYHCKEVYKQTLSKNKNNLLAHSEPSSSSSLEFITISEWNEEEEEERFLHHFTQNTSKTSSCKGNSKCGFSSSEQGNKEDKELLSRSKKIMKDEDEEGCYAQKTVEYVDDNNELKNNDSDTLSPNSSLQSTSPKGKYNKRKYHDMNIIQTSFPKSIFNPAFIFYFIRYLAVFV